MINEKPKKSIRERIAPFAAVTMRDKTIGPILGKFHLRDGQDKEEEEFISLPSSTAKRESGERFDGAMNQHVVVIGPSESGKTNSFVLPNIYGSISRGESFVVTDIRGELYATTATYAEEEGYTVKVLDTNACANSDSVDFISEMIKSSDNFNLQVRSLVDGIIRNTAAMKTTESEDFIAAEESLLLALLYYIIYEMPESKKKIASVVELLEMGDKELNALFDATTNDLPKRLWNMYYGCSVAFRGNVRSLLVNRLVLLRDEGIKAVTGIKDIDMTLPCKRKCAYYIVLGDKQGNQNEKYLIETMFVEVMISCIACYRIHRESQEAVLPVNMFLNGFCSLGVIPDFDKQLAMVRSSGISISILAPSILQISKMYPYNWEAILANCSANIFYKHNEDGEVDSSEKYLERGTGFRLTVMNDDTHDRTIETSDLLDMPKDKCLVVISGADAFFADNVSANDFLEDAPMERKNINEHYPLWRRNRDKIAHESFNREKEASERRKRKDKEQSNAKTLGDRIRELRAMNGWTQADLAERLGVTQQSIGNWENGKRVPDDATVLALCKFFKADEKTFLQLADEAAGDRLERLGMGATDGLADIGIVDSATAMQWSVEFAKKHFSTFGNYQIEIAARMLTFALITGILFDPAVEWWRDSISGVVEIYSGGISKSCDVFAKLTENRFDEVNSTLIISKGASHILEDDAGTHNVERLVSTAMVSFSKCSNDAKRYIGETLPSMLMAEATEVLATSDGFSHMPTVKAILTADMCGGYLSLHPVDLLYRYATVVNRVESDNHEEITKEENDEERDNREICVSRIEIPLGARYHVLSLLDGLFPVRKGYRFAGWAAYHDSKECLFSVQDMRNQLLSENYETKVLAPLMACMHGRHVRLSAKWIPHKDDESEKEQELSAN